MSEKITAYQIKHSLTFSDSDSEFKAVVKDWWATFVGKTRFHCPSLRTFLQMSQDVLPLLSQPSATAKPRHRVLV